MAVERLRRFLDRRGSIAPEAPVGTKRFSPEQKRVLEKQGFVIYGLTGQSIKTLMDRVPWLGPWSGENPPGFEALESIRSEVAINPEKLFLPDSNDKTLAQQEEMINRFSKELGKKVKGVKAIMGQVPDYVELIFQHYDVTGRFLIEGPWRNEEYYNFARTKTLANVCGSYRYRHDLDIATRPPQIGDELYAYLDSSFNAMIDALPPAHPPFAVSVGGYTHREGLDITTWPDGNDYHHGRLCAAPLVVPA